MGQEKEAAEEFRRTMSVEVSKLEVMSKIETAEPMSKRDRATIVNDGHTFAEKLV